MKPLSERINEVIAEFGHMKVLRHLFNSEPEKVYRKIVQLYNALPVSETITSEEIFLLADIVKGNPVVLIPTLRTSVPVNCRSISSVFSHGQEYHIVRRSW